jgi:hypothetical protein
VWNNTLLQFPLATAYWGTVGWGGLFDAPTGGNLLVHGPLVESRTVNGGEVLRFPINDLLVALG